MSLTDAKAVLYAFKRATPQHGCVFGRAYIEAVKMKFTKTLMAMAIGTSTMATAAQSATFDFFWSGNSATDATIVSSTDDTLMAVGTFDLDVANGATFQNFNMSNFSILMSGNNIPGPGIALLASISAAGFVSASGAEVTFTEFGFVGGAFTDFLICLTAGCADGQVVATNYSTYVEIVNYTDAASALASFKATAAVPTVPAPAALPLLLASLGGLGLAGRRRKA